MNFDVSTAAKFVYYRFKCDINRTIDLIKGLNPITMSETNGTDRHTVLFKFHRHVTVATPHSLRSIGNLHAGYVLPRRYGDIYMCFRGTDGDATWEMYGMGGKGDRLLVQSRADGWTDDDHRVFELSVGDAPGYGGASGQVFIADFIAASRGEGEFITSGDDALRAMCFVEAAYRGAATGTRISLDV